MVSPDYDVLVIGAGPAGSTAAALARQRGLNVGVVEKERFPRFRIGESLLPHGNAILRESGVWPKVERAGFLKKHGAFFFLSEGSAKKEVIFSEGMIPGLDYAYQVERAKFDALLLDHARELGAEIFLESTVRSVSTSAEGCRALVKTPAGERTVTARWLLDGSGRDNGFSCELKREMDPPRLTRRVAIYSHFRNVSRAPGYAAGHTVVVRLADGWFWLIPIDHEKTSVGLVTTVDAVRQRKTRPAETFNEVVAASPKLRELMAGAEAVLPFQVTTDYSYFRRNLADERMLLIGDAGGFFDPIFSSGVYVATYSAKRAIELIHRADKAQRALTPAEARGYTREMKQHAGVFEKLIRTFYDNASFSVFMDSHPPLRMGCALNSIVAGHAQLKWRLWWRFHLFFVVCWLQRRGARLVEPVAFSHLAAVETLSQPTPESVAPLPRG